MSRCLATNWNRGTDGKCKLPETGRLVAWIQGWSADLPLRETEVSSGELKQKRNESVEFVFWLWVSLVAICLFACAAYFKISQDVLREAADQRAKSHGRSLNLAPAKHEFRIRQIDDPNLFAFEVHCNHDMRSPTQILVGEEELRDLQTAIQSVFESQELSPTRGTTRVALPRHPR